MIVQKLWGITLSVSAKSWFSQNAAHICKGNFKLYETLKCKKFEHNFQNVLVLQMITWL